MVGVAVEKRDMFPGVRGSPFRLSVFLQSVQKNVDNRHGRESYCSHRLQ